MEIIGGGLNILALKDALMKLAEKPEAFKANLQALTASQAQFEAKAEELRLREIDVAKREMLSLDADKKAADAAAAHEVLTKRGEEIAAKSQALDMRLAEADKVLKALRG